MTKKSKKKEEESERNYQRLVEQESLILEATELIEELIEKSGENRRQLSERLGRSKGFVTQILSGERNMTLRTLADFAFALEHRVKVGATPLVDHGDGGEAMSESGRGLARVYAGASELMAPAREADRNPRRQLAAEGAGLLFAEGEGNRLTYFNARLGEERPDLIAWGTYEPLEKNDEVEAITG